MRNCLLRRGLIPALYVAVFFTFIIYWLRLSEMEVSVPPEPTASIVLEYSVTSGAAQASPPSPPPIQKGKFIQSEVESEEKKRLIALQGVSESEQSTMGSGTAESRAEAHQPAVREPSQAKYQEKAKAQREQGEQEAESARKARDSEVINTQEEDIVNDDFASIIDVREVVGNPLLPDTWRAHPPFLRDDILAERLQQDNCAAVSNFAKVLETLNATWPDSGSFVDMVARIDAQWPRSVFYPTSDVAMHMTDFRATQHSSSAIRRALHVVYNDSATASQGFFPRGARQFLNEAGLVLNPELFSGLSVDYVPIWLRVFNRIDPLDRCLKALRDVDGIQETLLVITIDGQFSEVLQYLVTHVDFVPTRLFWHDSSWEKSALKAPHCNDSTCEKLQAINSHWVFGVRLLTDILGYSYIASLEDDLLVSPDFYRMHIALRKRVLSGDILTVGGYSQGPWHDCHYVSNKLKNSGECLITDVKSFVLEQYAVLWGAGVTLKLLDIVLPNIWLEIYDCVITSYVRQHETVRCAIPCSTRVKVAPNLGASGQSNGAYSFYLPTVAALGPNSFGSSVEVLEAPSNWSIVPKWIHWDL